MADLYNTYTYNDPNPVKRWLHRSRFGRALKLLDLKKEDKLLDYGCGDGYFLKLISDSFPSENLFGFEPYKGMFSQAQEKIKGTKIQIYQKAEELKGKKFDKIVSLDTCEHLDDKDLDILFKNINLLLNDGSTALITVPIEIGLPAFLKNTYRKINGKYYDNLNSKNYFRSIFGLKIKRKVSRIDQGIDYIFSHMGFDHRKFEAKLSEYFTIMRKEARPFPIFRAILNNTIYYLCQKR